MMNKWRIAMVAGMVTAAMVLTACDSASNSANHIKFGVINGAEHDVADLAKKVYRKIVVYGKSL
ncbi:hypothetical protein [Pectobacterium brasiliense]|uniref:hypothetical protein n=1 Tax=Pectobacterium brasiliense TaxID=180957 RepID=UPI001F07B5ED|nr:hypothetical protein [Pectobacterium brasiliense]